MRGGWLVTSLIAIALAGCWHPRPREGPEPTQPTHDSDGDGNPDQRDACPWHKDPCPDPVPSPKRGDRLPPSSMGVRRVIALGPGEVQFQPMSAREVGGYSRWVESPGSIESTAE